MRLARVSTPEGPRAVVDSGDGWEEVADLFARPLVRTGVRHPADAPLLAPVEPLVVLGMAHNTGPDDRNLPPQAFLKSARTVAGPGEPIVVDARHGRVVGEVELAVVISRTCRNVTVEEAPAYVLGWTVANDVTAVDQVALDEKMVQAKCGDGFTPLGPWVETDLDPLAAPLAATAGEHRVASSSANLAWHPFEAIAYLSEHLPLGAGDVICTGAPHTSFPIQPGDQCVCVIEGIGTLSNPVVPL